MKLLNLIYLKPSWKTVLPQTLLLGLSLIYKGLVLLRLFLYQTGILKSYRSRLPVISVGNLTTGGAGKTPMVDFLVEELAQHQARPVILSRGYRRQTRAAIQRLKMQEALPASPYAFGDEPYFLASRHPEIPVYVGSQRAQLARLAEVWDDPDILLIDDGYQHLALHRDLNLLLLDATHGLSNGYLLPRGELREPSQHWQRADAIIITKCNLGCSERLLQQLNQELQVTCPIFKFEYHPRGLRRLDQQIFQSMTAIAGKKVLLSCGIARPQGVLKLLAEWQAASVNLQSFKDHHPYTSDDIQRLQQHYQQGTFELWITTEKDAVKLSNFPELRQRVWYLEMEVVPDSAWNEFFIDFLGKHKLH